MNGQIDPQPKRRTWRTVVQWTIAAAVLAFVFRRLVGEWTTVQSVVGRADWRWLFVALFPGLLYFDLRARAWLAILTGWRVRASYRNGFRVWMTAEALRYIPGTIWAVLGRVAQASALRTSKSIIGISLLQEALLMSISAVFVLAVAAIPMADVLSIPVWLPWAVLAGSVIGGVLMLTPKTGALLGKTFARVLRRGEFALGSMKGQAISLPLFISTWAAFAGFQILVARSFGYAASVTDAVLLGIAVILGWVLGYVTVFAPSGLGVREGVIAVILAPTMGATDALLVAALTRIGLILVEALALLLVLLFCPKEKQTVDASPV